MSRHIIKVLPFKEEKPKVEGTLPERLRRVMLLADEWASFVFPPGVPKDNGAGIKRNKKTSKFKKNGAKI